MKKKLLSLAVLAVTICLSISIGTSVVFALTMESAERVEFFANVNRSAELHAQVVDTYRLKTEMHDGKEFDIYSDDYAGVFIDEQGLLNVALVGEARSK